MKRIASFSVNHLKLNKGIYVSRIDDDITTYDIRMCKPNVDTPLDPRAAHAIEHIGATLLRNGSFKEHIIYFGPMGCMTGFYLVVRGLSLDTIKGIVREIFTEISRWDKEIPGAKPEECGNYTYMGLESAKREAELFINSKWEHEYHLLED